MKKLWHRTFDYIETHYVAYTIFTIIFFPTVGVGMALYDGAMEFAETMKDLWEGNISGYYKIKHYKEKKKLRAVKDNGQ